MGRRGREPGFAWSWQVMPYVAGGSVLNIMKYAYPEVSELAALTAKQADRNSSFADKGIWCEPPTRASAAL